MSLFGTLRSAAHSSLALSAAIKVNSDNIAGANDKDYDRQTANLHANPYTGGVRLLSITRAVRPLLEEIQRLHISSTGHAEQIKDIYAEISQITGLTDQNRATLSKLTENFQDAWREYNVTPGSQSVRNELMRRAEQLTTRLAEISNELVNLRINLDTSSKQEVTTLNTELEEFQRLNERIAAARGVGDSSGALESRRDGVIDSISKKMAIKVFDRGNGQAALYTSTGHDLVDDGFVSQFYFAGDGSLHKTGLPDDALFLDDDGNYRLTEGTLLGKLNALRDNLTEADPAVGILSRIEAQLDAFAALWTSESPPGAPGSQRTFKEAYDNMAVSNPPRADEVAINFFDPPPAGGTDRFNLTVNALLLEDPDRLKRADIVDVISSFSNTSRSLSNVGGLNGRQLNIDHKSYLEVAVSVTDHWSSYINTTLQDYDAQDNGLTQITEKLRSATGVDVNEEIAELTVLQNAYAANARVMNAVTAMLDALIAIAR